jgi:hypothetical protein
MKTPKRGLRVVPVALVLAVALALALFALHHATTPPAAVSSASGATATALMTENGDLALAASGSVTLTADDRRVLALKTQLADEYAQVQAGQMSPAAFQRDWNAFAQSQGDAMPLTLPASCTSPCVPSYYRTWMPQESQINMYYCGPAAVEEVLIGLHATLGPHGEHLTAGPYPAYGQHVLAGKIYLQTDYYIGTNWGSGVVPRTLNAWYHHHYYVAVNGSNMGGYFSLAAFEHDLILDVNIGRPLMGAVRMDPTPTRPHLIGFPTNQTHYHWIAISGYGQSGAETIYADSVHGDTQFWWWADRVPAFGTVSTKYVMVPLLNTFGFIW